MTCLFPERGWGVGPVWLGSSFSVGWDGAVLSLKGSVALPGEADDIYVLGSTTLVVADGAGGIGQPD